MVKKLSAKLLYFRNRQGQVNIRVKALAQKILKKTKKRVTVVTRIGLIKLEGNPQKKTVLKMSQSAMMWSNANYDEILVGEKMLKSLREQLKAKTSNSLRRWTVAREKTFVRKKTSNWTNNNNWLYKAAGRPRYLELTRLRQITKKVPVRKQKVSGHAFSVNNPGYYQSLLYRRFSIKQPEDYIADLEFNQYERCLSDHQYHRAFRRTVRRVDHYDSYVYTGKPLKRKRNDLTGIPRTRSKNAPQLEQVLERIQG